MSKKQARIPYRESKMTRILSLGQNNGMTVMILNLAPTKKFHQDTLTALNFANRAKTIEVKNIPPPVPVLQRNHLGTVTGAPPVRTFGMAKTNTMHNRPLTSTDEYKKLSVVKEIQKPSKPVQPRSLGTTQGSGIKKPWISEPVRTRKKEVDIEDIVEKKVEQILAARALKEASMVRPQSDMNDAVKKRLEDLERKLEKKADARSEGLTYILLAKQHAQRGEDFAALSMYRLAVGYFPSNEKLLKKVSDLELRRKNMAHQSSPELSAQEEALIATKLKSKKAFAVFMDAETTPLRPVKRARSMSTGSYTVEQSPRTRQLLQIINSEDVEMIMQLKVSLCIPRRPT